MHSGLHNPIDAIFHFQPVMALTMVGFAVSMEGSYKIFKLLFVTGYTILNILFYLQTQLIQ